MMFSWQNSTPQDKVSYLGQQIQSQSLRLRTLEQYYSGTQDLAFLPSNVADQLQDRIAKVNVNYCKVLTDSLTQRITVQGFKLAGADDTDPGLWNVWKTNNLVAESKWLIRDFLSYGRAYATVWTAPAGGVSIATESPTQFAIYRDPVTRQILGGCKQWSVIDGVAGIEQSWAVLYLPDVVLTFSSNTPASVNSLPSTTWQLIESVNNPLGVPPIVEFCNKTNVLDRWGTSEFESIMSLQDGLNKVTLDSLVCSEYYSFARRWITGFSVPDDSEGNPVQIFNTDKSSVWTAENAEARMGEFQAQSLAGYDTLSNLLTRDIAALSSLPEYLTGVGGSNPQSVDAINASELALTARASAKIDLLSPSFAHLAALALAIKDGRRGVDASQIEPVFANLTQQSTGSQTDAFTKLVASGVPLKVAAKHGLGWSDAQANELPETTNGNEHVGTNDAAAA